MKLVTLSSLLFIPLALCAAVPRQENVEWQADQKSPLTIQEQKQLINTLLSKKDMNYIIQRAQLMTNEIIQKHATNWDDVNRHTNFTEVLEKAITADIINRVGLTSYNPISSILTGATYAAADVIHDISNTIAAAINGVLGASAGAVNGLAGSRDPISGVINGATGAVNGALGGIQGSVDGFGERIGPVSNVIYDIAELLRKLTGSLTGGLIAQHAVPGDIIGQYIRGSMMSPGFARVEQTPGNINLLADGGSFGGLTGSVPNIPALPGSLAGSPSISNMGSDGNFVGFVPDFGSGGLISNPNGGSLSGGLTGSVPGVSGLPGGSVNSPPPNNMGSNGNFIGAVPDFSSGGGLADGLNGGNLGGISGGTIGSLPGGLTGNLPGGSLGGNTGGLTGSLPGGSLGGNTGGLAGGSLDGNIGSLPGGIIGGNTGSLPGGIISGNTGGLTGNLPGGSLGENIGGLTGGNLGGNTGSLPGGIINGNTGGLTGSLPGGTVGGIAGGSNGNLPSGALDGITGNLPGGLDGSDGLTGGLTGTNPLGDLLGGLNGGITSGSGGLGGLLGNVAGGAGGSGLEGILGNLAGGAGALQGLINNFNTGAGSLDGLLGNLIGGAGGTISPDVLKGGLDLFGKIVGGLSSGKLNENTAISQVIDFISKNVDPSSPLGKFVNGITGFLSKGNKTDLVSNLGQLLNHVIAIITEIIKSIFGPVTSAGGGLLNGVLNLVFELLGKLTGTGLFHRLQLINPSDLIDYQNVFLDAVRSENPTVAIQLQDILDTAHLMVQKIMVSNPNFLRFLAEPSQENINDAVAIVAQVINDSY